jgi:hypothetical protein
VVKRRFLGRYNDVITRHAVYATDTALEIDVQDNFEIVRKRVFYEDVLLVTMHERVGIIAIFFALGFAALLFLIAEIAGGAAGWELSLVAVPLLVYGLIRIRRKDTIITVFGRRSKARIRFTIRKERAHRIYGEICAHVRRAQTELQQETPTHDLDHDSTVREG